jgi:hypothetical protein
VAQVGRYEAAFATGRFDGHDSFRAFLGVASGDERERSFAGERPRGRIRASGRWGVRRRG